MRMKKMIFMTGLLIGMLVFGGCGETIRGIAKDSYSMGCGLKTVLMRNTR